MMKRRCLRQPCGFVAASLVLFICLQGFPCAFAQQAAGASTSDDDLVWLTVTVLNRKRKFLTGLKPSDFVLTDNKNPLAITSFSDEDAAQSVGIIFDLSSSVIETGLGWPAVEGLRDFLNASNGANQYFLMGFDEKPKVVADWTTDSATLMDRMRPEKNWRQTQTALYDSLYLALEKVKTGKSAKRVLIVITDGQDTMSIHSFREVTESLKESDVTLYAVVMARRGEPAALEGAAVLAEWAELSGGEVFIPESKRQFPEIFKYLAEELRHQYRVGFKPAQEAGKPKWHQLKVGVRLPPGSAPEFKDIIIQSRKGYYPNVARR